MRPSRVTAKGENRRAGDVLGWEAGGWHSAATHPWLLNIMPVFLSSMMNPLGRHLVENYAHSMYQITQIFQCRN